MARSDPLRPLDAGAVPWLLAVALATALPHFAHLPAWQSAVALAALAWRAGLWRQRAPLPSRWLLMPLVVVGVVAIGWYYRTLFGRDAGVALIVFFMAIKPLEMRTRRDAIALVMLGFFLLLTHYFYAQSIPTGLWLLAATLLLVAALIRVHGGAQPPLAIARYAAVLLAQALPFMLILFVFFPRVSAPLWGLPQDAYAGVTGLSDRMSPGSLSALIESGAIAFRVEFTGSAPARSELYWRGPVFDDYDGQTWRSSPNGVRPAVPAPPVEARGPLHPYVTTLEAHNQRWLLALDLPTERPPDSLLTRNLETLARAPVRQRARFAFVSSPTYVVRRDEGAALLRQSLQLPPDLNPRSRALAAEWRARLLAPREISAAALRFFAQQEFVYTLRPPLLGVNAVDDFLFSTRRGFCEHYASAYVVLMRAAGVPARVVAGYQGGEINPIDGTLVVRQSDAHAWAEIWTAADGWVRVDPTAAVAPSRIERGIDAALPAGEPLPALVRLDSDWLRSLRNRWEAANNRWNQWVLGYNPQRQGELLSGLSRLGAGQPDWRTLTFALAALCALALALVSVVSLRRRDDAPPAQRAWRRFCARLARLGVARHAWEGPYAFAERVAREAPQYAALVHVAAAAYVQLQYARHDAPRGPALQRLNDCTRRLPRPWRRLP